MTPILYHCADARSFRVLWMLEELGLPYDLRLLPFPPRLRAPEYLETNPLGTIPLYVEGDVRLTESAAIAHYLATRDGDNRLAVAPYEADYDIYLNALSFGEATLTWPLGLILRYTMFEPKERRLPQVAEDYRPWFLDRLGAIERALEDRDHLAGGRFTAADVSVGYALLLAARIGLAGDFPPRVAAYWSRLQARDAFVRAKAAQEKAA